MLGIQGLTASFSLLLEIGMAEVERAVLGNAQYLMAAIARHNGLELVTPSSPGRYGGIVSFRPRSGDAAALQLGLPAENAAMHEEKRRRKRPVP